jgi:hypothetical protein
MGGLGSAEAEGWVGWGIKGIGVAGILGVTISSAK